MTSKDNIANSLTKVLPRNIRFPRSRNGFKAYERERYHEEKLNLVNWRSQDLDSIRKSNCAYLKIIIVELKNSYPFL